jgi:ATP synthase protein I
MLSDMRSRQPSAADPLSDYDSLTRRLYLTTLVIATVAFVAVLLVYSLSVALSYLLGAVGAMLYFRMLERSVRGVSPGNRGLGGPARVGLFALIMVIAIKSGTLEVLPTFLGFLTIKAAILFDTLRTLFGDV